MMTEEQFEDLGILLGSTPGIAAHETLRLVLARADVYLDPMREREYIEWLEQTGRTAWAYGFSSVMISKQLQ